MVTLTARHPAALPVIELGRIALQFAEVSRSHCFLLDGVTPESDSDHTVMLGWVACALAARYYPRLDVGLVAQYALLHDMPEVFAGDTDTLRIDDEGREAKARRERKAFEKIRGLFLYRLPWVVRLLARYEQQEEPEARFVRAVDKILPKILHLHAGCADLARTGITSHGLAATLARQAADMQAYAADFPEILDLRTDLADLVLAKLADIERATTP